MGGATSRGSERERERASEQRIYEERGSGAREGERYSCQVHACMYTTSAHAHTAYWLAKHFDSCVSPQGLDLLVLTDMP